MFEAEIIIIRKVSEARIKNLNSISAIIKSLKIFG